ncbi:MAG: xanthine dehydrogenase family protein subunit M [Chloroflexi bacterium]|nr:xanthine dehydrogenase family protein subunit M [Chloroflexota bacterium]
MKPAPFEYHRPRSKAEALELLGSLGDEAKVLAGGQSLVALLNLRLARPAHLVDINRLNGPLSQIAAPASGGLSFGALVRQRAAEGSSAVREQCPLMAEALPHIGHHQIRNRGTVCGNLAHADPASELPAIALALDGEMVAESQARGQRTIQADDFFRGYLTTALEADELLTEFRLPAWPSGAGWSFMEVSRRHGDYALVGVAALVQLDANGTCTDARLAFTGAAPGPVRVREAEAALKGAPISADAINAAAERVAPAIDPQSDVHATATYRRHVAGVLARRALHEAAGRATRGARA